MEMVNVKAFGGMVLAILSQTGGMVITKVGITHDIDKYVLVFYTHALSFLLLLPFTFLHSRRFHSPPRSELTYSCHCPSQPHSCFYFHPCSYFQGMLQNTLDPKHKRGKRDSMLQQLESVDEQNFAYKFSIEKGTDFPEKVEKKSFEVKLFEGPNGGTVSKVIASFFYKGNVPPTEQELQPGEDNGFTVFKEIESYLTSN